MKYCEAHDFKDDQLWCSTHDLAADHLAANGDEYVCKAYAILAGCQNCPENRHKGELSKRQQALEFLFDKFIQAGDAAEVIVILEVKKVLGIRD